LNTSNLTQGWQGMGGRGARWAVVPGLAVVLLTGIGCGADTEVVPTSCASDNDCLTSYCDVTTSYCAPSISCGRDTDCDAAAGEICSLSTGYCARGCSASTNCGEGNICNLYTFRCVPVPGSTTGETGDAGNDDDTPAPTEECVTDRDCDRGVCIEGVCSRAPADTTDTTGPGGDDDDDATDSPTDTGGTDPTDTTTGGGSDTTTTTTDGSGTDTSGSATDTGTGPCQTNADCPNGEVCLFGSCLDIGGNTGGNTGGTTGGGIGGNCSSDADCNGGTCLFGFCLPGNGGGTTGGTSGDPGFCFADNQCDSGEICASLQCVPDPNGGGIGGFCFNDAQCGPNAKCENFQCKSTAPPTGGGGIDLGFCITDSMCGPTQKCDQFKCVESGTSLLCQANADCPRGANCLAGFCVPGTGGVRSCQADNDCTPLIEQCLVAVCVPNLSGLGGLGGGGTGGGSGNPCQTSSDCNGGVCIAGTCLGLGGLGGP
jgi:hypothetical protein